MSLLEVKNLTKRFGGLQALSNVTFSLEAGEILGLIGPNGAGKTTLFNCINGTFPPTAGSVVWKGQAITGKKAYQIARLGIVRSYQVVQPFRGMTTLQNAMVGAFCKTESYKEAESIAEEALEKVHLGHKSSLMANYLNLGERKKLEVAKAIATRPDLLLLDEVMAGLNTREVMEMLQIIRSLRDEGTTIILIEHIMEAIMNISDRIMVLSFGRKIAEGTPEEISRNEDVIEAYFGVEEKEEMQP